MNKQSWQKIKEEYKPDLGFAGYFLCEKSETFCKAWSKYPRKIKTLANEFCKENKIEEVIASEASILFICPNYSREQKRQLRLDFVDWCCENVPE